MILDENECSALMRLTAELGVLVCSQHGVVHRVVRLGERKVETCLFASPHLSERSYGNTAFGRWSRHEIRFLNTKAGRRGIQPTQQWGSHTIDANVSWPVRDTEDE